ncbi:MAG: ABC transporter substrate-binding protein [Spirochaetaceae bacterium]|nr:ABC transporter substrate-binding protein [Spirochaetaceae bacterium]
MHTKKTSIFALFLLTLIIALFPSCRKNDREAAELRYGFTTEPKTLDPLNTKNATADGRSILFNVFEGLVKPDTDGTLLPCVAESWTIEQDALVYTFTLREGVRFHDGSVVSAADVKFSLDTAAAAGFDGLNRIESVTITTDNRVRVTLKAPDLEFLPYITVGIVKAGNNDREKNIIGTGPFFIESFTSQRNLVLKKFDGYWQRHIAQPQDVPLLDKVTIMFYANVEAMMIALRSGNIDGANLVGSFAAQLDHRNFDVIDSYSAAVHLLALNNAAVPLDDIRVRRAINYGVDVQGIIDGAFFGNGVPSGSPIIPGLPAYYEASLSYPYDPQKARYLLAEAGFDNTRKPSLEITVPSEYTMHVDTAQVIVSQLEQIGITATVKLVDWNTWLSEIYRGRKFQATIISLDSPTVSARSFLTRYRSDNDSNFINFSNVDFDKVYEDLLTETDDAKRKLLYKDAQRIITADAASVYIQDILYYKVFRAGAFAGAKNYPLLVVDFSSIYRIQTN